MNQFQRLENYMVRLITSVATLWYQLSILATFTVSLRKYLD